MKLFSFQVRELAHLSQSERETALHACMRSPRYQIYRAQAPRITGWGMAVFIILLALLGCSPATGIYIAVAVFVVLMAARLYGEYLLLRSEARRYVAGSLPTPPVQQIDEATAGDPAQQHRWSPAMKTLVKFAVGIAVLAALLGILVLTNPRK